MALSLERIRERSFREAVRLGYSINPHLPLLDQESVTRNAADIADRLLCLNAVVASACGFSRKAALAWVRAEGAFKALSAKECLFLGDSPGTTAQDLEWRFEAVFSLAWCCSLVAEMDMAAPCPDDLVSKFPDLRRMEPASGFRASLKLRPDEEILGECDLCYCLHWAIRDAELNRRVIPGRLHPNAVVERRRGLEWLLQLESWDDVELNT